LLSGLLSLPGRKTDRATIIGDEFAMIAITFALPTESSVFRRKVRDTTDQERNGLRTLRGRIGNREVAILHTGVGPDISRSRVQNLLQDTRFDFLISSGFAGALSEDALVGDLILAENFSDPQLFSTARQILREQKLHTGKLFSSASVIDSSAKRKEIAQTHNATAVDMETEIIAEACAVRGIRMLSLRVISDTPREPLPAPANVLFNIARQRTNTAKLSSYLLKHPMAAWRLIHFARQIGRARDSLTAALVAILRTDEL
jgi:nucleoside phosphorylase